MKLSSRFVAAFVLVGTLLLSACGAPPAPSAANGEPYPTPSSSQTSSSPQTQTPPLVPETSAAPPTESSLTSIPQGGKNPFTTAKDEIYDLYLLHPQKLTYSQIGSYFFSPRTEPDHPIALALNALPTLQKGEAKPGEKPQVGFLIVREDYRKTQVNLLEQALEVDGTVYSLTPDQYRQLKELAQKAVVPDDYEYAQWLVWMNPNRITGMQYTDAAGRTHELSERTHPIMAMEFRLLPVTGGTTYPAGSKDFSGKSGLHQVTITFDSGVKYKLVLDGDTLYLESSDSSTGCRYQTSQSKSLIGAIEDAAQGILNPRTGKPVIYLYPEQTQEVSVKLHFDGTLSYTYPTYRDGWRVTAQPDGTLTNREDGSTHYYLFWDGTANFRDWDFNEGFVVKGTETEGFFRRTLPALGLLPREYNDFITYWTPLLMQNEYTLITFATSQYEAVAPLEISPAPDTVLRVHMVYRPLTHAISVPAQTLPVPPKRTGFTVVEWGGTKSN